MGLIKKTMRNIFKDLYESFRDDPYPETVAEVLDDNIKYKTPVIDAVLQFKKSNPWKGSQKEIYNKFQKLNIDLSSAYNIRVPLLIFTIDRPSAYFPEPWHAIFVEEETDKRYSVVTYLHEFGHAIGKNEVQTCKWSINLFKRYFPNSYAKLEPRGHLLYRKSKHG